MLGFQKSFGFARHDEFLVGGDHENLHLRIGGVDDGFGGARGIIFGSVHLDAQVLQVRANGGANARLVFAGAGGEHNRVRAV